MQPITIIEKYYTPASRAYQILTEHSRLVAEKAIEIARTKPELKADPDFIYEGAMLHDIGIFLTQAEAIDCHGDYPYICHGFLGADLLRSEGLSRHALVAERHTGTGISLEEIELRALPLPHRDMQPVSIEEKIICFADKFYSKNRVGARTVDEVRQSLAKHGLDTVQKFDEWCALFL
jgi:uncharacterized protein